MRPTLSLSLATLPAATRATIKRSKKWRKLFSRLPQTLLGIDSNAKTVKGAPMGFRTAILYLTPASGSGVNLCPMATLAQCADPCLYTAGRGGMTNVQMARLRKTLYYLQHPQAFIAQLTKEIARAHAKAERDGVTLLVRLNGTSDIRWEQVAPQLFAANPTVQFYDYTKIPNRKNLPPNYDLTFSYSGVPEFAPHVATARANKALSRIAVVFDRQENIPQTFQGAPCISGDDSDVRHIEPRDVFVALYAKGKARSDTSGFVVRTTP